ncbi:MAG: TonB-dependent receptor [Proteobacteria bacterium]|nr:TonB-dependent receptor [Pseudomonadota bacterium]HQR04132.1 TonB-dependent receptor [Rhodocyclaceae bacterium]
MQKQSKCKPLPRLGFLVKPAALAVMALAGSGALADSGGLEEVIVTAQKQAESMQNVPISIQAFDTKALETGGVTSVQDLRALAPALNIKTYPVADQDLLVTMRGVTVAGSSIYNDTPAAVNIDGVYIARNSGLNLAVADIASVEVLKGPQGTLYGRNTIAGALNITTARPSLDAFAFSEALTIGNYGRLTSKTSVNVPLTSTLAAKLAYISDHNDGFVKDSNGSGRNWGDQDTSAGRLDVRWKPADKVTVDYGYDWNQVDYVQNVNQCLTQKSSNPASKAAPTYGSGGPLVALAYSFPSSMCSWDRIDSIPMPNGPYLSMPPKNHTVNTGHTLRVEWEASSTLTVRSITSFRQLDTAIYQVINSDNNSVIGGFNINYPVLPVYPVTRAYSPLVPPVFVSGLVSGGSTNATKDKYLSQEFNFIGKPSETFRYTTGIYYFDEKGTNSASPGESLAVNSFGAPFAAIPGQGPIGLISFGNGNGGRAHNTSWALFGQFTWTPDILDRKLEVTAGMRYTRDTREAAIFNNAATTYFFFPNGLTAAAAGGLFAGATQAIPAGYIRIPAGAPILPNVSGSATFSQSSPSLMLSYHVNPDLMVYGKVVKGYRSGGFNNAASSPAMFAKGYAPENLTSTEVGFKGEFFDHHLRTNFALFQSKYDNMQINVDRTYISTSTRDLVNAGKATYNGWEADITAAVTDALRIGFSYSYVKFQYDRVTDQGQDGTYADVTQYFHLLPSKQSYGVNMDYSFGRVGPGKLDWNVNYAYQSENSTNGQDIYKIAGGVVTLLQRLDMANRTTPGYGVMNTRLAMSGIDLSSIGHGDLTVALWIKNLADKKAPGFVIDPAVGTMVGSTSPFIRPRTYGVDLIYRY